MVANSVSTLSIAAIEDPISKYIPFSSRLTEHIVSTRGGDYMTTWSIKGLPFEGLSMNDAYSKMEALNLLVRGLSNGRYAFWVHRVRRFTSDRLETPSQGFQEALLKKYY